MCIRDRAYTHQRVSPITPTRRTMPGMSTNSKHTPTPNNETPEKIRSRLRAQAKKARSALTPETRASKSLSLIHI